MEEKILEIIWKHKTNIVESTPDYSASKEIADTFERFTAWKDYGNGITSCKDMFTGEVGYDKSDDGGYSSKSYTLKELFSYWNTHINK